uniref:Leucine-rich repeat flightless-interacting protein 2 n=1 Tax=Knipowitschia caucasica TaxID=637954 RepID=A0AAV2K2F5_KNICA
MGTQGAGRKRSTNKDRTTAEDDALNLIAREAEARLAAKRAARAEAREIRMKELERQQKEIFQVQKKYYGLSPKDERQDGKWGDIEQWMSGVLTDESRASRSRLDLQPTSYASSDLYSLNGLSSSRPAAAYNGYQSSLYEDGLCSSSRRTSAQVPLEYSSYRSSGSRTSSRASSRAGSARTSPVDNSSSSVASYLRSAVSSGLRDLDDVTIPDFADVEDGSYLEKGSRAASALTASTLTSLGGTSSRRGSGETALTLDAETSIREIKEIHELKDQIQDVESKYNQNLKEAKDKLAEVEEKYRKAMVSNAQLDNEKNKLMYQVDTLKDSLLELEESLAESRRQYDDKAKDFEREKHTHTVLQFQFNELKETLKQSEDLLNEIRQLRIKEEGFHREISDLQETVDWKDKKISALERQKEYTDAIRIERDELREEAVALKDILKKHGIVLGPDLTVNGGVTEVLGVEASADPNSPLCQVSSPTEGGNSMLEIRLRKLVDEREKMIEQVKKLKAQLDQKSPKNGTDSLSPDGEILENGSDPALIEIQRDSNRQMNDLKFKLVKTEQEATALEQNVSRLEGQVSRYKSLAENAEKVEDELKAEKRKLQRELRSALDKVEELESNNSHLSKRLEKMKSSRGMAPTP